MMGIPRSNYDVQHLPLNQLSATVTNTQELSNRHAIMTMISKLAIVGLGSLMAVVVTGCGTGSASTTPHVLTALPAAISCSTDGYPGAFDKGGIAFADLYNAGVKSPEAVAVMPGAKGGTFFGTSALDKADRLLRLQSWVHTDGSIEPVSNTTMRIHPVSSEGNDNYKVDIDLSGEDGWTKHFMCVGPVAQAKFSQDFHAAKAQRAAQVTPHVKAGGFLCDNSGEVMGEAQLRGKTTIAFRGCQQIGADVEVNVLDKDPRFGAVQVGNAGGVAWVDERDLVQ
jgi:hypothetical protein